MRGCLRFLHWGPVVAFIVTVLHTIVLRMYYRKFKDSEIKTPREISIWSGNLTKIIIQRTWHNNSQQQMLISLIHMTIVVMIVASYIAAVLIGPGRPPANWSPEEKDRHKFQYCRRCEAYKPPRTHHCRICDTCVLLMDHHCPWVNNCVGAKNHKAFYLFCFYIVMDGIFSFYPIITRCIALYGYRQYIRLEHFVDICFAMSLTIVVGGCLVFLLYFQTKAILRNKTDIEAWIQLKADSRREYADEEPFVYPYDVGTLANLKQVFGNYYSLWWIPTPVPGDGITWPVRDGCTPFTFTEEQLLQKAEKRAMSQRVKIVQRYRKGCLGWSWIGCGWGWKTLRSYPNLEDSRINVDPGDIVIATRSKKGWLYGEKTHTAAGPFSDRERVNWHGWFPKQCATHYSDSDDTDNGTEKDNNNDPDTDKKTN